MVLETYNTILSRKYVGGGFAKPKERRRPKGLFVVGLWVHYTCKTGQPAMTHSISWMQYFECN